MNILYGLNETIKFRELSECEVEVVMENLSSFGLEWIYDEMDDDDLYDYLYDNSPNIDLNSLKEAMSTHNFKATNGTLKQIIEKMIKRLGDNVNLNHIDTSQVTDMSQLFKPYSKFNGDISQWNTSKVKNTKFMFYNCKSFNQPLNNWDVSKVIDMSAMFLGCESFNQPLDNWNVSRVETVKSMFTKCKSFNQDLSDWDVSNVTNFRYLFSDCISFDYDISDWDISSSDGYMLDMFYNTKLEKDGNLPTWYDNKVYMQMAEDEESAWFNS